MITHSIDLADLVSRGDLVAIDDGKLIIKRAGGELIPEIKYEPYLDSLVTQILILTNKEGFTFTGYSTHATTKRSEDMLVLQFDPLTGSKGVYAAFNVSLKSTRKSNRKPAGSKLPDKQFNPPKLGAFVKFWKRSGLLIPKGNRYTIFHEYMGNLKRVIYTGDINKNKFENGSIKPLNVSHEAIANKINALLMTGYSRTKHGLLTDKGRTSDTDKEPDESQLDRAFLPISNACAFHHSNKVIRERSNTDSNVVPIDPRLQSTDEWLAAHDSV